MLNDTANEKDAGDDLIENGPRNLVTDKAYRLNSKQMTKSIIRLGQKNWLHHMRTKTGFSLRFLWLYFFLDAPYSHSQPITYYHNH